ncbi:MAG: hypothetical protein K0S30_2403 [Clostridia bacterium]|jgi:hypothetical protein|nr:hypothetical protein [Clostridia bacterium]
MMQRYMPIGYKMVDGKIQVDITKEKVVKKVLRIISLEFQPTA